MDWAKYNEELTHLEHFIGLFHDGLNRATNAVGNLDAYVNATLVLGRDHPYPTEGEYRRAKESAETIQAYAQEQAVAGVPYLFGLAATKLWSILETLVYDLVLEELQHPERWMATKPFSNYKVSLADFMTMTREEQIEALAREYKHMQGADRQIGVGRLESMLNPISLGGGVDDEVKRALLELSQVRNVIVHRLGIVDARLVTNCPWLGLRVGQALMLKNDDYWIYAGATLYYILEVRQRYHGKLNKTPIKDIKEIQHGMVEGLQRLFQKRATKLEEQ